MKDEIKVLENKIEPKIDLNNKLRDNELKENQKTVEKKDPLTKLEMLIEIIANHPSLLIIIIPFYLFLLALDIIPLIVKELSQVTKYDNVFRNSKLSEVNLKYDKYENKTQEKFDLFYANKKIEPTDDSEQNSILKTLKDKILENVEKQNWKTICILGIICGLAMWFFEPYYENNPKGYIMSTIAISVFGNFVYTGIHAAVSSIRFLK